MLSLVYILESQIILVVLYAIYILFLHRKIDFRFSRLFLLGIIPVSMLLPLISIPVLSPVSVVSVTNIGVADTVPSDIIFGNIEQSVSGWFVVYITAVAVMFGSLLYGVLYGVKIVRESSCDDICSHKIYVSKRYDGVFSFFGYVVIGHNYRDCPDLHSIIIHEIAHVKLHHSVDVFFINFARVILWFNPAVWHIVRLLKEVHEYQADYYVIENGVDAKHYIQIIINAEIGDFIPVSVNSFSYLTTKKRIAMILKSKNLNGKSRLFILIPVLGALMSAFCLTSRAEVVKVEENSLATARKDTVFINGNVKSFSENKSETVYILNGEEVTPESLGVVTNNVVSSIKITKMESFEGTPLFVVDGKILTQEKFKNYNVERFSSMVILKGAAAMKLYGEDGKNGAVVVTTKK